MTIRIRHFWQGALCLVVVGAAAPVAAQQGGGPPRADTTQLVFEREVFQYPAYARRNPFRPLLTTEDGGPRFERLRLLGILFSEEPGRSVALLSAADAGMGAAAPVVGEDGVVVRQQLTFRVRVGQRVGNTTVLRIEPKRIIVEVEEFGLREERELVLPIRGAGRGGGPE